MDKLINARGKEIEAEIKKSNPVVGTEALMNQITNALAQEFGVR